MSILRDRSVHAGDPPLQLPNETFLEVMRNVAATVAIVTTMGKDGAPRGLTVSAFCSVSLDPPLVLVSLSETSGTLDAIRYSRAFTVNFLARGTEETARLFASSDVDRFAKLDVEPPSLVGAGPILTRHITGYLECGLTNEVEAGDHRILIGLATCGEQRRESPPLVYHQRQFVELESD